MLQDIYFSIRFVLFFTHEDVFSCRWMSVFRPHCVRASTEYVVRRRWVTFDAMYRRRGWRECLMASSRWSCDVIIDLHCSLGRGDILICGCGGGKRRGGGIVWRVCKILYTPCSTRLMSVTLLIFNEFSPKKFAVRFSRKIAPTYLSKTPPHPKWVATLPNARYITRYSSYIYKLWWGFNDQSKSGLLLSLTVKTYLKSANIWHSYGQKDGLCRALS